MKRVEVKQEAAQQVEEKMKKPLPDYIREMRATRKQILTVIQNINGSNQPKEVTDLMKAKLAGAMRSIQIVNAFSKGLPLSAVESGDIRNAKFAIAANGALDFMRTLGESVVNKQFDIWFAKGIQEKGAAQQIKYHKRNTIWFN